MKAQTTSTRVTNSSPVRRNGLGTPWHPFQMATWLLFALVVVHYFAFLMPLLWDELACKILVTFFFCLWTLAAAFGSFATCKVNPADDAVCHLLAATAAQNEGIDVNRAFARELYTGGCPCCYTPPSNPEEKINCYYCKVQVHSSSKHCIHCNKCVLRFDHHCKWLNTCVGKKNYNYFLTAVFSIAFMISLSLALSIAYLVESFAYKERMKTRGESFIIPIAGIQGISIASVAVLSPIVAMVYQLAGFHIMLNMEGITTYEFIVKESNKSHDRKPKVPKREAKASPTSPSSPSSPGGNYTVTSRDEDVEMTDAAAAI